MEFVGKEKNREEKKKKMVGRGNLEGEEIKRERGKDRCYLEIEVGWKKEF